jgi:hypothetical protein
MLVADPHSPDFNTYASVVDLRAFAAGRGYTIPADDGECGQMLMQAMDFWKGSLAGSASALTASILAALRRALRWC